jgi:hypothetical protein
MAYERAPDEFKEQFKFCTVLRVRAVEPDGCTVHCSRVYLTDNDTMLRTMATVKRRRMKGLTPGFRMRPDDFIIISEDGTTSIQRKPNGV